MARLECYPVDDPETLWQYCPSYPSAIAYSVLFGLITIAHIIQAGVHRKWYGWVLIMGGIWETAGYAVRTLAVIDQHSDTYQIFQQLFILLAPLWINAFCYMTLGRMIHCFMPPKEDKIMGVRARVIALLFVLGDIFAFVVQLSGGLMINDAFGAKTVRLGINIYMGGVGVQLFFIAIFIVIAAVFQRTIRRQGTYDAIDSRSVSPCRIELTAAHSHDNNAYDTYEQCLPHTRTSIRKVETLLYALYAVLLLIIFRNMYRLIEFSAGAESSITRKEWYTFVFDSTPMLLALLVFNGFHPGRFLRGPRADFSAENRERKMTKKEKKRAKKEGKKAEKEEKKAEKREKKAAKKAVRKGSVDQVRLFESSEA